MGKGKAKSFATGPFLQDLVDLLEKLAHPKRRLVFLPDGRTFVGGEGNVQFWRLQNYNCVGCTLQLGDCQQEVAAGAGRKGVPLVLDLSIPPKVKTMPVGFPATAPK